MDYSTQLQELGLSLKAAFIPNPDGDAVKWSVTLCKDGRGVLITEFTQGIGHLPKIPVLYLESDKVSNYYAKYLKDKQIKEMCVTGKQCRLIQQASGHTFKHLGDLEPPSTADVVSCLILDSDVLNYASFEEWAENYGYDSDSIKAKKIYDSCMVTALQMRANLGDKLMAEISDLLQDY